MEEKKEQKKKPFYKRWWFIVIVVLVVLYAIGSMGGEDDSKNTGSGDNGKEAAALNDNQDNKTDKEEPAETKKETYVNTAEAAELFTGKFEVGKDLKAGRYEITCQSGSGNVIVYENDMPVVNEVLTSPADSSSGFGITKIEADIADGSTVEISGLNKVFFNPATIQLKTTLTCGNYIVGRDVPAGDYIATAPEGSGNFIVYNKSGFPEVNEILGKDDYGMAVEKVKLSVKDGSKIAISGLETVVLE